MGFLELMVMMVVPYFIICRVGRKYPNPFALALFVLIGVVATVSGGLFYITQTYDSGHPLKEMALKQAMGMGFWFSLLGSVVGAFHGRKWAAKDAAMANKATEDAKKEKRVKFYPVLIVIGFPIIMLIAFFLLSTFSNDKEKDQNILPEALVIPKSQNSGSMLQDRVLKKLQKN